MSFVRFLFCQPLLVLGVLTSAAAFADPPINAKDLPRIPPTEPARAAATFELKKGFALQLAACEPLVTSPVAIAFDERGRMFVVEMRDYPDRRDDRMGRVRVLEDTHGDGVYDKATVYADGLPWPTGVCCYDGGVFVIASPDIFYLKDTRGDGVADVRRTVFTGFGAGLPPGKLNVQGLANNLTWGLDNRIHGATSTNGAKLVRVEPAPTTQPLELRGRDFSFDPRTLDVRAESGGGQHGMSFSSTGRKFVCSNSHHLQAILYDARYAGRNPLYAMPSPLVDIAADGPAAEVYRASPDEAWRVIRTQWRVAGLASGPIEGGGRASGYFTGATGVTIYTGDALPPEFVDNAFIADAGSNLVHRKVLRPDGVSFIGERPKDEDHTEFLRSRDIWFRPVDMKNGPDGALYVIDMYREVIEHPWSLPDSIKQYLDLHSGVDRGRIWRIVPEGFKRPSRPAMDKMTTAALVAALGSPNGWTRETASRLLYQRADSGAVPLLVRRLEAGATSPVGKLWALSALSGLGSAGEQRLLEQVARILGEDDESDVVRAHAVRLLEPAFRSGRVPDNVWETLSRWPRFETGNLLGYQLALAMSESADPRAVKVLADVAEKSIEDPFIRAAILNSSGGRQGALFKEAVDRTRKRDPNGLSTLAGWEFFRSLATLIGNGNREAEVREVVALIRSYSDGIGPEDMSLASALATGLRKAGDKYLVVEQLQPTLKRAAEFAGDARRPDDVRLAAIELLGAAGTARHGATLLALLSASEPAWAQSAAVSALDQLNDPATARELIARLPGLSPKVRSETVAILLKRPDRAAALLEAMKAGKVRTDAVSPTQAIALRAHRDPAVNALAKVVYGQKTAPRREDVIKTYTPALDLNGDAARGREMYRQRCISCHRSGGEGFAVGPDFVTIKTAGKEKTLVNILDPNREVAPQYVSYIVETKAGDTLTGIIVGETAASLTVRQPFGNDTAVLRADVKRVASQNLSLMPEGIEEGMSKQDLADLLEWIATAEK